MIIRQEEFLSRVASATGFTKKDTREFLEAALMELYKILINNNAVRFPLIGKIESYWRKERPGVDPNSHTRRVIPGKWVPKIRGSKKLLDGMNHIVDEDYDDDYVEDENDYIEDGGDEE